MQTKLRTLVALWIMLASFAVWRSCNPPEMAGACQCEKDGHGR